MDMIALVDSSTALPKDGTAQIIAVACDTQLRTQVGPAWDRAAPCVKFFDDLGAVPMGVPVIFLFDTADQAGALGYHTKTPQDTFYARVFVKTCLDNGASLLNGANSVSGTTSHEAIELFLNPRVNVWADDESGKLWIMEGCDWVESDEGNSIPVVDTKGNSIDVGVSNFLFPAAFDTSAQAIEPMDFLSTLSAPFSLTAGGYATWLAADTNAAQQTFARKAGAGLHVTYGADYPEWKKQMKRAPGGKLHRLGLVG